MDDLEKNLERPGVWYDVVRLRLWTHNQIL